MSNKISKHFKETLCLSFCCLFLMRLRDTCYGNRHRNSDSSRASVARSVGGANGRRIKIWILSMLRTHLVNFKQASRFFQMHEYE